MKPMDYTNWLHIKNLPNFKTTGACNLKLSLTHDAIQNQELSKVNEGIVNSRPILTSLSFTIKLISIDWKHTYIPKKVDEPFVACWQRNVYASDREIGKFTHLSILQSQFLLIAVKFKT